MKNSRYLPLKDISCGGILIMRDTQSDQPETIVETVKGLEFNVSLLKFIESF